MKSTKKRIICFCFVIFMCVLFIPTIITYADEIIEAIGETRVYLYEKYPIDRYYLETYVDTSSNWLPWNWLKAGGDLVFFVFHFLLNVIVLSLFNTADQMGQIIQGLFRMDFITIAVSRVTSYIQEIAGIKNNALLRTGLYPNFLTFIIVVNGFSFLYLLYKKQTGELISKVLKMIAIIIASIGFISSADKIIIGANGFVTEIQNTILESLLLIDGEETEPSELIRETHFELSIYKPYLLLQYGTTRVDERRVDILLSTPIGERGEIVRAEAEGGNRVFESWTGLMYRLINIGYISVCNLILGTIFLLLAAFSIYHQFLFLIFLIIAPFVFVRAALPEGSGVLIKYSGMLIYHLGSRLLSTIIIVVMFSFSRLLFSITVAESYLAMSTIQIILYVTIYKKRKELLELILGLQKKAKEYKPQPIKSAIKTIATVSMFASHIGRMQKMVGGGNQLRKRNYVKNMNGTRSNNAGAGAGGVGSKSRGAKELVNYNKKSVVNTDRKEHMKQSKGHERDRGGIGKPVERAKVPQLGINKYQMSNIGRYRNQKSSKQAMQKIRNIKKQEGIKNRKEIQYTTVGRHTRRNNRNREMHQYVPRRRKHIRNANE
jgi:hypothetical protein